MPLHHSPFDVRVKLWVGRIQEDGFDPHSRRKDLDIQLCEVALYHAVWIRTVGHVFIRWFSCRWALPENRIVVSDEFDGLGREKRI